MGDNYVNIDIWSLYYRFALAISSTVIFTIVLTLCCSRSAHRGPPFVRRLVLLLGFGSFAGILFSMDMIWSKFYNSWLTFAYASVVQIVYIWCNTVAYWNFSVKYLSLSRNLWQIMVVQGKTKVTRTSTPLDFYDEWYRDNATSRRITRCLSIAQLIVASLAMVGWCVVNGYNWDCKMQSDDVGCSHLEDWIGSILGYNIMYCCVFYLDFIAVWILVCAISRIRKALYRIEAQGFEKNFTSLRIHICITFLFLATSLLIGGLFNLELFVGLDNLINVDPFIFASALQAVPSLINQLFMLHIVDKVNKFYQDGMNGEEGYVSTQPRVSDELRQTAGQHQQINHDSGEASSKLLRTTSIRETVLSTISIERRLEDEGITSLFIERESIKQGK